MSIPSFTKESFSTELNILSCNTLKKFYESKAYCVVAKQVGFEQIKSSSYCG